ncbi:MAG: rod shape-determining protein MreC [Dysgonamonadaceae bacterium]|nr:rod shape-determining protein MreC [Dysgonamonadaceae bacterium]
MRNLIQFLLKNTHWLFFFLFVFLSITLIVNNNRFQRSKYLAIAQEVNGNLYTLSSNIEAYMDLKNKNADLLNRIAELENTVYGYERQLELQKDTSAHSLIYTFTPAKVVYNRVSGQENYITLNKGSNDSVEVDMGVISSTGIVGIIIAVSPHFSLVIPVLNAQFHLSCKVKNNDYFGSLVWDGKDPQYAYLQELPRHVNFEINDTVITSSYSAIFPEGLPVGKVIDSRKQKNDDYTSLKIALFTNFSTLTEVLIIRNIYKDEQLNLQREALVIRNIDKVE